MAEHNEIGKIGEEITARFLMKQGFRVIERNYKVKVGEIDIIAEKDNVIRFIEVKSVKVRDCNKIEGLTISPQDNLTFSKWSKLLLAIEMYTIHKNIQYQTPYQIDLACVYIDTEKKEGRVIIVKNIYKERE